MKVEHRTYDTSRAVNVVGRGNVFAELCSASHGFWFRWSTPQTLAQLKSVTRVDGACKSRAVQGVELSGGFRVRPNNSGRNHIPYHDAQSLASTCTRVLLPLDVTTHGPSRSRAP